MSVKLIKLIEAKGGIRCILKYLQYLTLKCQVKDRPFHTELGCLYVQYISRELNKKFKAENEEIDFEKAKGNEKIQDLRDCLRNFLYSSSLYEPTSILALLEDKE